MLLTESKLKQIVREEYKNMMREEGEEPTLDSVKQSMEGLMKGGTKVEKEIIGNIAKQLIKLYPDSNKEIFNFVIKTANQYGTNISADIAAEINTAVVVARDRFPSRSHMPKRGQKEPRNLGSGEYIPGTAIEV